MRTDGKTAGETADVTVKIRPHPQFQAIYEARLEDGSKRLATRNLAPGRQVYGERLVRCEGVEFRLWDPFRSKLAAAVLKGLKQVPIAPEQRVLYLGAASGTTPSHVSDIVGEKGTVFCVEFSSRSLRELVDNVCTHRLNMLPILEDARFPKRYEMLINGKVDDVYCDVAQVEQAEILAANAEVFLKNSGWIMLAVKAQSIDVTKDPSEIYKREMRTLEKRGFRVAEIVHLEPYDKAHAMITARKQG